MADRNAISDARITASTVYDTRFYPYYGRLHENRGYGGWCPRTVIDRTDYLQVDVGAMLSVCAVATQGEKINNEWTTNYKLQLSADGVTWNTYEETSTAKVWSATVINDYRTIKIPIQWVTKATFKIPPLQARVWFVAIHKYDYWPNGGTKSIVSNLPKPLPSWRNKIAIRECIHK